MKQTWSSDSAASQTCLMSAMARGRVCAAFFQDMCISLGVIAAKEMNSNVKFITGIKSKVKFIKVM